MILNTKYLTYLHWFRTTFRKSSSEKVFHWCWLIHFFFLYKNIIHTKVSAVSSQIIFNFKLQICIFLNSWTTATAFSLSTSTGLSEIFLFYIFVHSCKVEPSPSFLLFIQKATSSLIISSSSSVVTFSLEMGRFH